MRANGQTGSGDSSIGTTTARGWTIWVRFLAVQDLYFLHSVRAEPAAHPASYQVGTGASFPGGKAAGA
jgi:hypothetical protein